MAIKNITPEELRCSFGPCPAVYEIERNTVLIVGAKATVEQIEDCAVAIGPDETAVVVSKDLLLNIFCSASEGAVEPASADATFG